jgi:hypothetical protein
LNVLIKGGVAAVNKQVSETKVGGGTEIKKKFRAAFSRGI